MPEHPRRGVTYHAPNEAYFEQRGLRRFAGAWSLWALGVGAVISFGRAAPSPAFQREQLPDYLRRA